MSSTTERQTEGRTGRDGQILVVFAGGLVVILLIAALVFDVGQNLLDRRTAQNVSDAAALAGARYVVGATYTYHGPCSSVTAATKAPYEACQSAASNRYVDGEDSHTVRVDLPPVVPSAFSGMPGYIEVTIGSTRQSFFEGIIGVGLQRVGAMAVATNASDIPLPNSLLALTPTACGANKITGSVGSGVTTNGTVHVDSSCPTDALLLSGNGVLNAPQCDVVGGYQWTNNATNNCTSAPTGVLTAGDPLSTLPTPAQPGAPAPVQPLDAVPGPIPAGCPGSTSPATDAVPATCAFSSGQVTGKHYRIFPGNYPGGIATSKSTLYMDPGIYWIGGGGIKIQTDGVMISKATLDNTGMEPSGGVLIYNTADPDPAVAAACATAGGGAGCYSGISLNGGGVSNPTLALLPIQSGQYQNMVIFVDRTQSRPDDIVLNGENSSLDITGTIYAPRATVKINGSSSDAVSAQIICWSFQVNGSGGTLTIDYDGDQLFHLKGVGLVE